MLRIMAVCKKCGFKHPSSIQMKTARLENDSEQCPSCRQMSIYNKEDYLFE